VAHRGSTLEDDGSGFDMFGRPSEIPHDPQPRQQRQDVIGHVYFPPEPSLIGGRLIVMVIVVPAFSTAEYGKNETVLTPVVGFVPDSTDQVRERIDEECTMIQRGRRNKHAPDETREAPDAINEQRVAQWWDPVEPVEETDFRISTKVSYEIQIGSHILWREYPSDVRKPPSSFQRGMHIFFLIRVFMVMPMVGRPPQHAFLCGCHREERQDKLEYPAGLERTM